MRMESISYNRGRFLPVFPRTSSYIVTFGLQYALILSLRSFSHSRNDSCPSFSMALHISAQRNSLPPDDPTFEYIPIRMYLKYMEEFDFDTSKCSEEPIPVPKIQSIMDIYKERFDKSWEERAVDGLMHLQAFTITCSMCNLGRNPCEEKNTVFDAHVFSTMNASKWMVVGQNPGFNECVAHEPFVGDAGKFFNKTIAKGGLKRNDFYISNCVKCHTVENAQPTSDHMTRCEPILRLEIMILKPVLVVALGSVAFKVLCPGVEFSDNLGKIVKSEKFNVNVFPVYHPSPRNINLPERKDKLIADLGILCKLIKAYRKSHPKS